MSLNGVMIVTLSYFTDTSKCLTSVQSNHKFKPQITVVAFSM